MYLKKKTVNRPKEELKNLLLYAQHLIHEVEYGNISPIFTFIKMLTDRITLERSPNLFMLGKENYNSENPLFIRKKGQIFSAFGLNNKLPTELCREVTGVDIRVSLSKDPVIIFPRYRKPFVSKFAKNGENENIWQERSYDHRAQLFLPMGVTYVHSGKHSTFSEMVKRDGELHIYPGSCHEVFDLSELYPYLQFNGKGYVITGSDIVAGASDSFALGCIYEIGRMLVETGIRFKGLEYRSLSAQHT